MNICALIITKDRPKQIQKCLKSIKKQSYSDFDLFVVDAGEKSVEEIVNNVELTNCEYIKKDKCKQSEAYIYALDFVCNHKKKYDFVWLLHDDVIASKDALKALVEASENNVSFVSSLVLSNDGKTSNVPNISGFSENKGYGAWPLKLGKTLVRIADSSFCSVLIKVDAIKKVGLPRVSDKFGDASNYLSRLIGKYAAAYLVGASEVVHDYPAVSNAKVADSAKNLKVCAVVVTFNRKVMLVDCIKALLAQSYEKYDISIL